MSFIIFLLLLFFFVFSFADLCFSPYFLDCAYKLFLLHSWTIPAFLSYFVGITELPFVLSLYTFFSLWILSHFNLASPSCHTYVLTFVIKSLFPLWFGCLHQLLLWLLLYNCLIFNHLCSISIVIDPLFSSSLLIRSFDVHTVYFHCDHLIFLGPIFYSLSFLPISLSFGW